MRGLIGQEPGLRARLSVEGTLHGRMSAQPTLKARVASALKMYPGPYEVTPKVGRQDFATASKVMSADLAVLGIPRYDVSNQYGTTVIIATEE